MLQISDCRLPTGQFDYRSTKNLNTVAGVGDRCGSGRVDTNAVRQHGVTGAVIEIDTVSTIARDHVARADLTDLVARAAADLNTVADIGKSRRTRAIQPDPVSNNHIIAGRCQANTICRIARDDVSIGGRASTDGIGVRKNSNTHLRVSLTGASRSPQLVETTEVVTGDGVPSLPT